MTIKCGVGSSSSKEVAQAATEACVAAHQSMAGGRGDLTLCFSSVAYDQEKLLAALRKCCDAPLFIGCSDAGGIVTEGPIKQGVCILRLMADNIKFTIGVGENIAGDARRAGMDMAKMIKGKDNGIKLLIMLADGLAGNGADIVRGILDVMGDKFPVVGGAAGDDFLFKKTYEYFNGKVLSGAAVGVGLSGDFSFGIGVRHGWMPIGSPLKVTRSKGNVLYELDDRPAIKIYEEYFGEEMARKVREEPLARMAITYPLGMKTEESDEYLIRDPITVDENGAITCAAEIPEGAEIRLMIGGKDEAISAARAAAAQAVEQMKGKPVRAALVFNCIAREKLFGKDAVKEIEVIREVIGREVPLIGFYTYGEQAPIAGKIHTCSPVFHNETVVILTLGD
ncbi:FIST C-terminal domain-containing protein [Candidatus Saganbacteria bacterium]|nr:FIST C-terminal domain-containing protein [Candidatus Saganbacteria bacterium]